MPNIIHDTIYIKGAEAIDILNKTNDFYNSAWEKLLIVGTVISVAVGVIVPYLFNSYQQRLNKIDKKELKKEIADELKITQEKLTSQITELLNERIEKIDYRHRGIGSFLQASSFASNNKFSNAFIDFIKATQYFMLSQDYSHVDSCLNNLNILSNRVSKSELEKVNKYKMSVSEHINEIKQIDKSGEQKQRIDNFLMIYNNLPE